MLIAFLNIMKQEATRLIDTMVQESGRTSGNLKLENKYHSFSTCGAAFKAKRSV